MIANSSLINPDMNNFLLNLDCSKAVDIINEKKTNNYKLEGAEKVLLSSLLFCTEISKHVRLILNADHLIFCSSNKDKNIYLLYNPIQIKHISIRSIRAENELLGEYSIQFLIQQQKLFTMILKSKEERNMWLGIDKNVNTKSQSFSTWKPLSDIVKIRRNSSSSKFRSGPPQPIQTNNAFAMSTDQSEGASPLISSHESEEETNSNHVTFNNYASKNNNLFEADKSSMLTSSFIQNTSSKDKYSPPVPPIHSMNYQPPLYTPKKYDQTMNSPAVSSTNTATTNNRVAVNHSFLSNAHNPENVSSASPVENQSTNYFSTQFSNQQDVATLSSQETSPSSSSLLSKKPSFMKSFISAVSIIQNKNQNKTSVNRIANKSLPNMSSSLDNRQNQFSEPPVLPQYYTLPPLQQPAFLNRQSLTQSTPSFTSAISSSKSSLNMTPPLSQPSSPSTVPLGLPSSDSFNSPPESPRIINRQNSIKSILYTNNQFKVFRWKNESWCTVEADCILEVRQTFGNRTCVAVFMRNTGQLYLNAWILPDTLILRTSDTDLSLSIHITNSQSALDDYLFHCEEKSETDRLNIILEQAHQESIQMNLASSATSTLRGAPPLLERSISLSANKILSPEEFAKTFKLAMKCKCKLFVQSGSSKWSRLGSVHLKISQQYTTKKMHIAIDSQKSDKITQLVSAMVLSNNVERLNNKQISFMLADELGRNTVVYMIQVREETTGDKIIEYIKTKNAENGW